MKTQGMAHQIEAQALLDANPEFFAIAAEQGTGKTWMLLNDAERQFWRGRIDGLLVIAPKGVHTNWIRREIPTHLEADWRGMYYIAGAGARRKKMLEKVLTGTDRGERLDVFSINIDALNTKDGFAAARKFLMHHEAMAVVDESSRIKTLTAARTKRAIALSPLCRSRRIASGTMITTGPPNIFPQFEFLKPRGALLGTRSYRAFVAEYAEVMPAESGLVREITKRTGRSPQIVARDPAGRPLWKNLEKLGQKMAPYTFRVLKKDCLDLPDKIRKTIYFEMTPAQRKIYDKARDELRYERDNGLIDRFTALSKIVKLRQIASGFIMVDGEATTLTHAKPRLDVLSEFLEDNDNPLVIWASFREELARIAAMLGERKMTFAEYHGGIGNEDRERAIDDFQSGKVQVFVGNQQAAGIGLTLTTAREACYYSQSHSLELRLQSEDRTHRIGTKSDVLYTDICAVDSIDEQISAAHARNQEISDIIFDII